jgi:hypothetical protein
MVHPSIIEARLGELKFRSSRWFRAEIHELQHVLMDHEKIIALACGRYFGSFALLVATDQRLLLIDKRVFFMNLEDTRYDMISEIDYNSQAYNATVTIHTINKVHKFTSIKHKQQLRELTNYVQRRVSELRNAPQTEPMPDNVLSQLPKTMPTPMPSPYQPQIAEQMVPQAPPPISTSYSYSPATNDDVTPAFEPHHPPSSGVAQLVGSTAMQATHHYPSRPFNPYIQGSLMSRRPMGSRQTGYF